MNRYDGPEPITPDFIRTFENEGEFYAWLYEQQHLYGRFYFYGVINDIIELLLLLHLEKFVMVTLQFKHENDL